ncbi:MAG: hypothetical protein NW226_10685 [Microscillaceae bacterium]|nr:hypothetical protein [Microscillaceae bacterium]
MKNKIHIADINKERIFRVPEGYFQTLPILIQQKINEYVIGLEKSISHQQVFLIPESYFEKLPEEIQHKIAALNTKALDSESKANIFSTPENYFEELSQKIQAKITEPQKSLVPFYLLQRSWVYTLVGVMILIALFYGGMKLWILKPQQENVTLEHKKPINTESSKEHSISQNETKEKSPAIDSNQKSEESTYLADKNLTKPKKEATEIPQPSQLAYQALKEVPKEAIEEYLQLLPNSQEEILETLLDTEQAAAVNLLPDLLLESDMEDLYQGISDQELKELDQLFDSKKIKKSQK